MKGRHIATMVLLSLILIIFVIVWLLLSAREWVELLVGWIRSQGMWDIVAFAIAYIVMVVALAPAEIMSITAGLISDARGFPLVVMSATIGAILAFLVSRYMAREFVKNRMECRPLFRVLDRAIEQEGWKVVALFRLNPLIPFNLQNYFFDATAIGLKPYALATLFGIMPGSAAFVYLGTIGGIAIGGQTGGFKLGLVALGLIATAVVAALLSRTAKRKSQEFNVSNGT
ncbi:MAG: TVP38/TMEM64 family protein [Candidatus Acidiferrales bacterium]